MTDLTEKHIVAIDLGTSKIALTVAKVSGDDVQIVYHNWKDTPPAGIKYSGVYNIREAFGPLAFLIKDAEEALCIKINQAVIGMPKYPIRHETNSGKIQDRGEDTEITAEDIANLKRFAQETYPLNDPKKEAIYGAVAQSFSDGEYFQIIEDEIIGMTSDVLEGHFKIFIGRKRDLKNADELLKRAGITSKKKYFTAETTAKAVLTDIEMENGVAHIDFGGGSTSVTIYHGNIMRHYASIPFGGKNITHDIKNELQISERLAENIKLAFGACLPDKLQSLSEKVLVISGQTATQQKEVTVKYLSEIITARVEEIIQAILYEISESGLAEHLRGGIVITGGCAHTANLGLLISQMSGYKVRIGYPLTGYSFQGIEGVTDSIASTSMGLIKAALEEEGMNCAVYEEGYHTEVEEKDAADVPVEAHAEVQAEEPCLPTEPDQAEEVCAEPYVEEPEEAVLETTVQEAVEEESEELYGPEPEPDEAPEEAEDEDYDPELEDDDENTGHSFIDIFWGGIRKRIRKVEEKTDEIIGGMAK